MTGADRLIVACDAAEAAEIEALADGLHGTVRWLKLGTTALYGSGLGLVDRLAGRGFRVMVDPKLHDVPSQVHGAVRALADHGGDLLTVHAAGGPGMLEAARAGAVDRRVALIGVTVLTSLDAEALEAVGCEPDPVALARRRARLAMEAALDGVVTSPREASVLRADLGPQPEILTPGIRASGDEADDQRRTRSAGAAVRSGASRVVVGRPVTRAARPAEAASELIAELEAAA